MRPIANARPYHGVGDGKLTTKLFISLSCRSGDLLWLRCAPLRLREYWSWLGVALCWRLRISSSPSHAATSGSFPAVVYMPMPNKPSGLIWPYWTSILLAPGLRVFSFEFSSSKVSRVARSHFVISNRSAIATWRTASEWVSSCSSAWVASTAVTTPSHRYLAATNNSCINV